MKDENDDKTLDFINIDKDYWLSRDQEKAAAITNLTLKLLISNASKTDIKVLYEILRVINFDNSDYYVNEFEINQTSIAKKLNMQVSNVNRSIKKLKFVIAKKENNKYTICL